MAFWEAILGVIGPVFLISSPLTSYSDQILTIHRKGDAQGFSIDIPFILITSSLLKIFYWPGKRFDTTLLIQSVIMVLVQILLLKVILDNRSGRQPRQGLFSPKFDSINSVQYERNKRLLNFWRWRQSKYYWSFVLGLVIVLILGQLVFWPGPEQAHLYTAMLGGIGLTIEALLPIPQLHANRSAKSCKGFRISVLANWLIGDALKMCFFFFHPPERIPLAFKLCGCFQAFCDVLLLLQYLKYGSDT